MPAARGPSAPFAVYFDELAFAEDLAHATAAGRRIGLTARREFELNGVGLDQLLRCDPHGRDGTQLERCAKIYLPAVGGAWRMVFEVTHDPQRRQIVLSYLAFGVGHPAKPWQPSAYQVAHQRLHPEA